MPLAAKDFVIRIICTPFTSKQTRNSSAARFANVDLQAHDLSQYDAEGITYEEAKDRFVIVLDPNWNTSDAEALDTIRHEAGHVATWDVMDPNDVHGPPFQECMKRFAEKE
jgi:hypothetical protein